MPENTNDSYTLTDDEKAVIEGLNAQAQALQRQIEGALLMVMKIHGIEGNRRYENGKLVKGD